MAKIDPEINRKRGERVKELLKSNGKTQAWLAGKLFLKPEHLNMLLNGKRNLGEDKIQIIASLFPDVQIDWLLGISEYKTENQRFVSIIEKRHSRRDLICSLIALHGYTVAIEKWNAGSCHIQYPPGISDEDLLKRAHNTEPEHIVAIKSPSGAIRYIERCEYADLVKSLDDYIEMQLSFLFRNPTDGAKEYWG